MYIFQPFFIQFPCCGYHDDQVLPGFKSYAAKEANVLVLSGCPTRAAWVLVEEVVNQMKTPHWFMMLGAPQDALYQPEFLPAPKLKMHVCIQTCPVTKEVVEEGFRLLFNYVKKEQ